MSSPAVCATGELPQIRWNPEIDARLLSGTLKVFRSENHTFGSRELP